MTDWLPWTGTAVRLAAFPAPTGPLGAGAPPEAVRAAAPDAPLAGRGALGTGARSAAPAPPMVAGEEAPAEQPAASAQAPAASRKACAARRRDGETQARCTRAIMPIGRQHRHGGSHGNVTTWQLYWPGGAPPGAPRWPAPPFLRHGSLAVLARGSDPRFPRAWLSFGCRRAVRARGACTRVRRSSRPGPRCGPPARE